MKFKPTFGPGQCTLTFDGKPSADIRTALKANKFRWTPAGGYWWNARPRDFAGLIDHLQRMIDKSEGRRPKPDGACWKCQASDGFHRLHGAASTVLCDECERLDREEYRRRYQPDTFDMAYEDADGGLLGTYSVGTRLGDSRRLGG